MIDKRINYRYGGDTMGGPNDKSGNTGGNGGNAREERISQQYSSPAPAPAPAPARDERVSPIESIARVGDTSLAGKTKTEADNEMAARNREEAARRAVTTPPPVTPEDKRENYISKMYTPPPVTPEDKRENYISKMYTPPITPRDDRDYKTSLVDTNPIDIADIAKRSMFNFGLGKVGKNFGIANINLPLAIVNFLSSKFGGPKIDPYSTVTSKLSDLKSKFASTKKPNIDTKTGILTVASGDGRQIEQPKFQQAISTGEGLESGKKLLGLTEEETNYFNKLFASRDREFLQNALDQATIRIQSGKATKKEKDVHALLQEYLIDPKKGIMEAA